MRSLLHLLAEVFASQILLQKICDLRKISNFGIALLPYPSLDIFFKICINKIVHCDMRFLSMTREQDLFLSLTCVNPVN